MARPRDQAERREELVQAAGRAVLQRGSTKTRLRDVADEAGLTPASVLYYYADMQELLTVVFEQGTRTYIDRRRAAVEDTKGPWEKLVACVHSGVPFPGEAQDASLLLYELVPLTFRSESASKRQSAFFNEQAELYRDVLAAGELTGAFRLTAPAEFLGRSFVALEDGYGIEVLAGATSATEIEDRLLLHARLATQTPESTL